MRERPQVADGLHIVALGKRPAPFTRVFEKGNRIAGPREFEVTELVTELRAGRSAPAADANGEIDILDGFPERIEGELLWLPKDNMNTDGIYGKDVTYRDDLTPEQMATHAFRNYDPEFQTVAKPGDLIVGGRNFGSGSSREQAATAIHYFGIPLVVAASYSQTYKRNAFNNGFPLLECPGLVDWLVELHAGDDRATIRTGKAATVDFRRSVIVVEGREFPFPPLGEVPQRLTIAGGAEAVVRESLS